MPESPKPRVSSESDSAALAPLQQELRLATRAVAHISGLVADWLRSGSLRERSPGVWQARVSLGRDPATRRYRYAAAAVGGTKRDAQRASARLVNGADQHRIPMTKETFGGLLTRWIDHIEARGRAPKRLVENRRMAAVITEKLGATGLRKREGSVLDGCNDRLSRDDHRCPRGEL